MENATDALIMAGSVLIFLIALSVCVSSFTTLRTGIDQIIDQTETVDMAQKNGEYVNGEYVNGEYVNYIKRSDDAIRVVGSETVVSSMYRAKKENYVIYIVLKNSLINSNEFEKIGMIVNIPDIKKSDDNIIINKSDNVIKLIGSYDFDDILNQLKLYESIKDKKFEEYLGVYQDNTDATEENKITYRIITYIEI